MELFYFSFEPTPRVEHIEFFTFVVKLQCLHGGVFKLALDLNCIQYTNMPFDKEVDQ